MFERLRLSGRQDGIVHRSDRDPFGFPEGVPFDDLMEVARRKSEEKWRIRDLLRRRREEAATPRNVVPEVGRDPWRLPPGVLPENAAAVARETGHHRQEIQQAFKDHEVGGAEA